MFVLVLLPLTVLLLAVLDDGVGGVFADTAAVDVVVGGVSLVGASGSAGRGGGGGGGFVVRGDVADFLATVTVLVFWAAFAVSLSGVAYNHHHRSGKPHYR